MEKKIKNFLCGAGWGSGWGAGWGDGAGWGVGAGAGDGAGDGAGVGDGAGCKITEYQGKNVYYIDSIPCVFESVHETWSAVLVIDQNDFSVEKAFIAKLDGYFAHGDTIKDAFASVTEKVMDNMDFDEKKKTFFDKFPSLTEQYAAIDFFSWHHIITGSCEFGRKSFAKEHDVDLDGSMTVKRFIELTKESYGGDRIKELEGMYKKEA